MVVIVAPSVVSYPKDMFGNFSKKLRFQSHNFFMNIESNLKLFIDFMYYITQTHFTQFRCHNILMKKRGLHFDDPVSIFFVYSCSHFSFDLELTGRGLPPWKSKFFVSEPQAQKQQQQQQLLQQQQQEQQKG